MLPSPRTSDTNGAGHHGDGGMDLRTAVAEIPLLPTPAAQEPGYVGPLVDRNGDPAEHVDRMAEHAQPLSEIAANVLMPTPRATDGTKGGPNQRGSSGDLMLPSAVNLLPTPVVTDVTDTRNKTAGRSPDAKPFSVGTTIGDFIYENAWGEYGPAIRRWEAITRPAPEPTKLNAKGNPKLSDEFDEWLMGLPAGWITDAPGVTWNEALKACGNGVVPQQAAEALRFLRVMADWQVAA